MKILVEGRETETLAGHISLARPFRMDLSLVGSPIIGATAGEAPEQAVEPATVSEAG